MRRPGHRGEQIAAEYLSTSGYVILQRNFRYRRSEVDILAMDGPILVIVEVKTRKDRGHGHPEQFVSGHKRQQLMHAAEGLLRESGYCGELRFDIIAVRADGERGVLRELRHFKDAFFGYH